jgi:hypothetical protein
VARNPMYDVCRVLRKYSSPQVEAKNLTLHEKNGMPTIGRGKLWF